MTTKRQGTKFQEMSNACRELRKRIGVTQEAFAREQDWSLNGVSRYELGSRTPNRAALRRYLELALERGYFDLVSVFGMRIFHTEGWRALPDFMLRRLPRDFERVESLFVNILLREEYSKLRRDLMAVLERERDLEQLGKRGMIP